MNGVSLHAKLLIGQTDFQTQLRFFVIVWSSFYGHNFIYIGRMQFYKSMNVEWSAFSCKTVDVDLIRFRRL